LILWYKLVTSSGVLFLNGVCPRLHASYTSTPKLHTSLAVEYFLKLKAFRE
jgi:hypothetical protein